MYFSCNHISLLTEEPANKELLFWAQLWKGLESVTGETVLFSMPFSFFSPFSFFLLRPEFGLAVLRVPSICIYLLAPVYLFIIGTGSMGNYWQSLKSRHKGEFLPCSSQAYRMELEQMWSALSFPTVKPWLMQVYVYEGWQCESPRCGEAWRWGPPGSLQGPWRQAGCRSS